MATKTPTPRKRAKAAAAAPVRHEEHDEHAHQHTEEEVLHHDLATGHGLGSRIECCTECCPECQTTPPSHGHHEWDHFPTDGELAEHGLTATAPSEQELLRLAASSRFAGSTSLGDATGLVTSGMPDRTIDRTMLDPILRDRAGRISPDLELHRLRPLLFTDVIRFRPSWHQGLMRVIASYGRVRRNHLSLSADERDRFNRALAAMDGNPAWQTLLNYHANAALYRIHSIHGPIGTQRFLSWHRKYLFEAEQMLRTVEPTLTIPYWDYAADGNRPDWVHLPSGVNRPATGTSGWLPSGGTIATILGHGDYTGFTTDLESNAHNQVHNWCGGTLRNPSTASFDPIFWMLHGNVDRIWSVWQETHTSPTVHAPSVTGADAVLDPWAVTITDVDDTAWDLAYRYA